MSTEYFVVCDDCMEGGHIGSLIRDKTMYRVHHPKEIIESIFMFCKLHSDFGLHHMRIIREEYYYGGDYKEVFSDVRGHFLKLDE